MAEPVEPAVTQAEGPDPKAFFEAELPGNYTREMRELEEHVKKMAKRIEDLKAAEATIQFHLTGDGGGVFNLNVKDGAMSAGKPASAPILTLTQSIEDWRKMQTGGVGSGFNMFATAPNDREKGKKRNPRGPKARLTLGRVQKLRALNGAIQVKLTDLPEGGEWRLLTKFGPGPTKAVSDCTISIRYQDSMDIVSGKLNPQAAFMSGRIKVEGNLGFAMQLLPLMTS